MKRNSIYIEFGGPAGMYSMNYDRIISNPDCRVRIVPGFGLSVYNNIVIDMPIHVSAMIGKKSHHAELGFGMEPEYYWNTKDNSDYQSILFGKIGYRYQRQKGGVLLHCSLVPMYYINDMWSILWFSIGMGYSF